MLTLLITVSFALAEQPSPWTLTPVLQLRPRLELDTARDGAPDTEGWFVSQRSRLGMHAEAPRFLGRVVLQDVRVWGTESDTLKDYTADGFDVHEAWAKAKLGGGTQLTIGRQELNFDEQRLVGAVDWAQQARAFDAARLSWGQGPWSGEVAGAVIYEGAAAGLMDKRALLARGGWKSRKDGSPGAWDLVSITETDGETKQLRETAGLYLAGGTGPLSGRVEATAQLGSVGNASYQGYMVGLQGTLAPKVAWKPRITLWFDNLSGDEDLADDTLTAFQAPFGTNHKFYGIMDVMCYTQACWVDGKGLRDAALKVDVNPAGKLRINLDAHAFLAAAPQGGEAMLGQEIDLWASQPVGANVSVSGGLAVLARPDLDPDLWAYLTLDLAP